MKFAKLNAAALRRLQANLRKLNAKARARFTEKTVKELAARLLSKVIKRTPVRNPEDCPPGVVGGTLRRGWTVGDVSRKGDTYSVEVYNPVEYAPFVEFGHRTRSGKGWVPGRFMMTVSERELEEDAPGVIERKLAKFVSRILSGRAD